MSDVNVSVTEEGTVAVMVGGEAGIAAHDADPDAHAGKDTSLPEFKGRTNSFLPPLAARSSATVTPANERDYAIPFYIPTGFKIVSILFRQEAAGPASSVARLGVRDAGDNGYPDALLADAGTVAYDTGSAYKTITGLNIARPASGYAWATFCVQGGAGTAGTVRKVTEGQLVLPQISNAVVLNTTTFPIDDGITGALPASWAGGFSASTDVIAEAPTLVLGLETA